MSWLPCCLLWGGRTKQSGKQSMMAAEVFPRIPGDANEISHCLAVEEIELACLLLDWRNALLMLGGEGMNGEGGDAEGLGMW